jgi:hypothetical protein
MAYTYASSRDRGRRWTLSTALASKPAFAPTVRRATERILPVTTPRSCSTPGGNNVEALYRDVGNPGHVNPGHVA